MWAGYTAAVLLVFVAAALALIAALAIARAASHLRPGSRAPEFRVHGALGGEVREFNLPEALASGPVVLAFYPKSFTKGCTTEMRAFAARIDEFEAAGATVVGVSGDDLETQRRFSASECAGKVLIVSDPGFIAKRYRVAMAPGASNRTSYAIAPDGTIAETFTSLFEPLKHVDVMLRAVQSPAYARRTSAAEPDSAGSGNGTARAGNGVAAGAGASARDGSAVGAQR